MRRRFAPLLLALAMFAVQCTTAPQPQFQPQPQAEAIPLDPAVRRGTLENGLTYYIRVNGKPENRAELRLAIDAGSVLDSSRYVIGVLKPE